MMIYAAFMVGLLGSLHCLGMCGPIAFALPVRTGNVYIKTLKYLIYNLGRIVSYSALGIVIGIVGKGLVISGLQQTVSIVTGVLMIASVFFIHNPFRFKWMDGIARSISSRIKSAYATWFRRTGTFSLFILGSLNGLLPCGMVYLAMLGALGTGSVWSGAAFMAAFGLGTLPMMLSVSLFGQAISSSGLKLFKNAIPIAACLIGTLLIVRGLQLDVPIVSTKSVCCEAPH
jgi:sulfite exporter TauE/SafE